MPEVYAGQLGEFRAMSTASGGTALTTTATYIQFPEVRVTDINHEAPSRSGHIFITPRNFATAVVAKLTFNPWLTILKTSDGMATLPIDYSIAAQDGSTSTSVDLSSLNTEANGDWLLVGSHMPFRGVYCDVDGVNSETATLTVSYWNGSNWASASATNGTSSSTTFDQDGLIYWAVPTLWKVRAFQDFYPALGDKAYYSGVPRYWTKWTVSAALSATVTIDSMVAANRSTAYGELVSGQTLEERVKYGFGGWGCVEALTNAGTANLIVDIATEHEARF